MLFVFLFLNWLFREANQLSSEMKKDADFAVTLQVNNSSIFYEKTFLFLQLFLIVIIICRLLGVDFDTHAAEIK